MTLAFQSGLRNKELLGSILFPDCSTPRWPPDGAPDSAFVHGLRVWLAGNPCYLQRKITDDKRLPFVAMQASARSSENRRAAKSCECGSACVRRELSKLQSSSIALLTLLPGAKRVAKSLVGTDVQQYRCYGFLSCCRQGFSKRA